MSQVRFAQSEDIPALVDLGRQMHVKSRYAWMQFNAKRLWDSLEAAIPNTRHCLIVATSGAKAGEVEFEKKIGVLWACITSLPFSRELIAQVDYLYVVPKWRGSPVAMKMMAGLRRWAQNREVGEIIINNTWASEQPYSGKFLNKLGIASIGTVHSIWMNR